MTTDEKLDIFRDRLNGCSYAEIKKKYNVSQKEIMKMLHNNRVGSQWPQAEEHVYPELSKWIYKNLGSLGACAEKVGAQRQSISKWLRGETDMSKRHIDKFLLLTGMTYEELFRRKEEE